MRLKFYKLQMNLGALLLSCSILVMSSFVGAQPMSLLPPSADGSDENAEINILEQELKTAEVPVAAVPVQQQNIEAEKVEERPLKSISQLNELAPFSQVSVIQRKFLPKSERFQIYGGLLNTLNNPWYNMIGLDLRFGYHLTEAWALEAQYNSLIKSETQSIKEIRTEHDVVTSNLISPKGFMGLNVVWHPVYGKISLLNKRIIPFDLYFYLGGGTTSYDGGQKSDSSSVQAGTGQIFALSKAMAFRWDLNWNNFSASPLRLNSATAPSTTTFNHINLTAGFSFFFPEAKYR